MADNSIKTSFSGELYKQFDWYDKTFTGKISEVSTSYFFEGLEYKLIGLSVNMNVLTKSESFFVTKVQLDEKNEFLIRISQDAIRIMLDKILGKLTKRKFDLSKLTDLEAKIITSFNNALYDAVSSNIDVAKIEKQPEFLNLSYNVRNVATNECGKLIITVPKSALSPVSIQAQSPAFEDRFFENSLVDVTLRLGLTNFPVIDVKKLDIGDLVLFENSRTDRMTLYCEDIIQDFSVRPNDALRVDYETINGGGDMDQNVNLWDSIQVEMSAEFDKVKISLGELKDIEEGQVVDISSVYNNKVSLKVGDKTIAKGELVIVNDRFGVKIDSINSNKNVHAEQEESYTEEENYGGNEEAPQEGEQGEELDYSDFELDGQDV
ncbi:FliM/FliN family flagellar motor switch protein [bacterium]|nr:FliM/FliN family flagellar motor switch protein [bacterium]